MFLIALKYLFQDILFQELWYFIAHKQLKMNALQSLIHSYCQNMMAASDFNKHQSILEQLRQFILDWKNISVFRAIVELDGNPQTTFVLYELLQKSLAQGLQFQNVPAQRPDFSYDYENQDKYRATEIAHTHIDIASKYLMTSTNHPSYVLNTVLFCLAYLLRKYWSDILNIEDVIDNLITRFMASPNLQPIGCRLFENLLNCIRQYYYANGYLEFRKVMVSFQRKKIPLKNRQSLMRILNCAHQLLKVHLQNKTFLTLWQQDKPLCESLIQLLYQLIQFNFNLSFYELDTDQDNKDTTVVNFPESYFELISNCPLLHEIFRGSIDFFQVDYNISLNFILMLQRIGCVRQSLFHQKKCKKFFRTAMWEGINFILSHQQLYLKNTDFCNEFNSLVYRIINNLTLRKVHKFKDQFDRAIQQLMQMYQTIIRNNGFRISQQNVCVKMQEMWNHLGNYVQLNRPADQDVQMLQNCQFQNFSLLLRNMFEFNPFVEIQELQDEISVKKFKKYLDNNFQHFHQIYQLRQMDYLNIITEMLRSLPMAQFHQLQAQEQQIALQRYSTILCIVSTLVLYSNSNDINMGFEIYQIVPKEERPHNAYQNRLISQILELVPLQISLAKPNGKIYHMSVMIFIESFVSLTIDALNFEADCVKATTQLYQSLLKENLVHPNYLRTLEVLLEKCFQVFTLNDPQLVEQGLKLIEQIYSKVKRQLPRRFFRECSLSLMLRQFFLQLDITCFNQVNYIRKRRLVYKIISIVWVDDSMDDYIPAIVEIYRQIKKNISQETSKIAMLKYIWDLIGVADEIDVDSIYRSFLRIIYPDLASLLNKENVAIFATDYDSSMGLLTLLSSIFFNKNTRLSSENIQLILYQIYGKAMGFFTVLCEHLLKQPPQSENVLKQTARLLKVTAQISQSRQINQGFLIIYGDQVFLDLFQKQLNLIQHYRHHFQNYPKYKKTLYECLDCLCNEHSETFTYRCTVDHYIQLFQICKETLQEILQSTQNKGEDQINEDCTVVALISNLLCNVNAFLIQEASVGHPNDTQMIKNKIIEITQKGLGVYTPIFELTFQLMLSYGKHLKIASVAPDILFAVSLFNPSEFQKQLIFLIQQQQQNLSVVHELLEKIQEAFKCIDGQIHPHAKELFTKKIKTLFDLLTHRNGYS